MLTPSIGNFFCKTHDKNLKRRHKKKPLKMEARILAESLIQNHSEKSLKMEARILVESLSTKSYR
jgi:hypothetical protein